MNYFKLNISFILICLLVIQDLQSKELGYVDINKIDKSEHLAKHSIIIEDKEHKLAPNIVLDNPTGLSVIRPENDIPYMDFTKSTYWMQINLQNSSANNKSFYLELARPLTNQIELILYDDNNEEIQKFQTGDDYFFDARPYQHRKFIFPLTLSENSKHKLLIKSRSDGEILKLPIHFWNIDEFTQFASVENFFLGLYYGSFILVVVLFAFFGFALRQRLYVYFVSYVFFLGLFQYSLDGLAYQYLWPNSPWIGNHAILILAAISMLSMLFYFSRFLDFSNLNKAYRYTYYSFTVLVTVCLILSFTSGFLYAYVFPILNGLSFIIIFFLIYGIYLRNKLGNKPEIAITMAFVCLCLGAISFILSNVNLINNEFLANNALKIGSGGEVLFLSIAMASRYRRTQNEKIQAQKEAFNRLEEINKLKSEQTEKLEQEVKARTIEISEKNDILSEQNKEIINSITYAKRLQDAVIPSDKTLVQLLPDCGVLFLPKDIVSGDFYWIEETDNHVFFAVADCTGHGVPGAMVSMLGNNALNRCINEYNLSDPGKILDSVTELIENTLSKNENTNVSDGMDIALCSWDKKETLVYAGAYNPLYLIRDNELEEIKANKQPIGKYEGRTPFTSNEIKIKKGDSIYLFSDGYADQFGGPNGKKLKYANFKKYLIDLNNLNSAQIIVELAKRFDDWKNKEEQIDDVCVMNVKF